MNSSRYITMHDAEMQIQFVSPNKPSSISFSTPPPWALAQVQCQTRILRRHLKMKLADIAGLLRFNDSMVFERLATRIYPNATFCRNNTNYKHVKFLPPKKVLIAKTHEPNPNNSTHQWLKPVYGQNLISQRPQKFICRPATIAAPVIRLPVIISASKDASLRYRNKVQAYCQWRLRASGETQRDVDF